MRVSFLRVGILLMPRYRRNLMDGGYYHILTRGNDRKVLFKRDQDYRVFIRLLAKYLETCLISIQHYCLMNNHIHLLLKLEVAKELPKFMQGVLQSYAHYFRKQYGSSGFLFQNRYKSLIIDSERYLLEAARYIERNPMRAGLVSDMGEYPWSSFHFYALGKPDKIIIKPSADYLALGETRELRQRRYTEFMGVARVYDEIIDEAFKLV